MLEKIKKLKINVGWKSLILIGVCVALILVDLLTKIFEERDDWNFTVIPKLITVVSGSRNPGCAFSFLADAVWGQTFLIVMTFILLILLAALFIFMPERLLILKICVSVIIAGAIGNLIDRIAFHNVRDFVEVNMFGNWVSCNFADFWITFGTALAVIDLLFLNEYAVLPLTKRAKEAQKNRDNESNTNPKEASVQVAEEISEIEEGQDTERQSETVAEQDAESGE